MTITYAITVSTAGNDSGYEIREIVSWQGNEYTRVYCTTGNVDDAEKIVAALRFYEGGGNG